MKRIKAVSKWFFNLFVGAICGDILVLDWSGLKSKVTSMMPVLGMLLPHLAFALLGTVFILNIQFFRSLLPSNKFGSYHESLSEWSNQVNGRIPRNDYSYSWAHDAAKRIIGVCVKFKIPYPPPPRRVDFRAYSFYGHEDADRDKLDAWGAFADDIARCSSIKALRQARAIYKEPS